MKKIRLGLIGCGGMMRSHAQAISMLREELEITAVCDLDPEAANAVASVLDGPYVTADYTTMVPYVDAVLVVLPHDLHYECGMFFAQAGKHILMEKPLCNTEEECLSLIETCEAQGVTLMCAYPVRYWPGILKLKELVDSGEYGRVIQMSVWTEQLTHRPGMHWHNTGKIGGGQFFSHGCHYVDLLLWFLGEPVSGAHFGTRIGTPWLLREGTSAAIIQFASGAIGYHGATWGARGTRMGYDFQIQMEKGMLEYDRADGTVKLYNKNAEHRPESIGKEEYTVLFQDPGAQSKQTQHEILHFLDCIRMGKTPATDGRSALQGLRVIWRMYDAEKHGTLADLRGLGIGEA